MEIQDGQGYGFSFFGKGTWPIFIRRLCFYVLFIFAGVCALQYVFAKGSVQAAWPHQAGIGTTLVALAILDSLVNLKPGPISLDGVYGLFQAASAMLAACLWDSAFNRAAIFAVVALGLGTWMLIRNPRLHCDSEEATESQPSPLSRTINKRRVRRKKNKNKRR
jgi:hypothetical protein